MKRLFILLALVLLVSCTNPDSRERQGGPVGPSPNSSAPSSPISEPTGPPLPTISSTANALRPASAQIPVGSTVYLLPDKDDKDRYGRFLRYVWAENGEFYNDKAVRLGYAKAVLYMPNDLYIDQMREAEAEAKANKRGLWGVC